MDVKVNFSIPVHLFNYRESDNSLYSYAKLKIFYVGETGDRRLFTKEFSDQLIESLPYVPVVGYYDEEDEDFKGHHQEVQNIYGIVPEDTKIEYIKEDGKEYAVCDVILYTGRNDKTGHIAQKIVGKQHSLELNPKNTTYDINRDSKGNMKNIEFKTGTLLGLSILGDNEKPAFSGSGFFTENSEFMRLFEGFKTELKKFTQANQQRGENMNVDTDNIIQEEVVEQNTAQFSSEEDVNESGLQTDGTLEVVEENKEEENHNEEVVNETNDEEFNEVLTREQRFTETFMKVTYDEVAEKILSAFYTEYGDYVYVVQWSPFDNILVYMDFQDGQYYRVGFSETEETIAFSEKVLVKLRFLTEEEINTVFTEGDNNKEDVTGTEESKEGTKEFAEGSSDDNKDGDVDNEEFKEEQSKKEGEKELDSAALNNSEREELEAFRREKKEILIDSFLDDLEKEFLSKLKDEINTYSYDELEIILSKEFTRMSRQDRKNTKPNTFVYVDNTTESRSEVETVKALIEQYKTKK